MIYEYDKDAQGPDSESNPVSLSLSARRGGIPARTLIGRPNFIDF